MGFISSFCKRLDLIIIERYLYTIILSNSKRERLSILAAAYSIFFKTCAAKELFFGFKLNFCLVYTSPHFL